MPLGKEVSGVGLSLRYTESLLWGWNCGQPVQWTLFPFSNLGRAQKVYFFTPRLLSTQPSSAAALLVSSWQACLPCWASVSSQECSGPCLPLFQNGSGI